MRQKFIDTYIFDHFLKDNEDKPIVVAMGEAAFSSCAKGSAPIPKKKIFKALANKVTMIMVNEFNTSQKCNACYSQLKPIKMFEEVTERKTKSRIIKRVQIHELKQCVKHCNDSGKKILCNVTHNRDSKSRFGVKRQ